MKVFAIGDLHLSGNPPSKPMTIFGDHWGNHWERIQKDWSSKVCDEDIVCIVGDTSWAMRLSDATYDLKEIASLPGQKYIIRGNHDYWWSSAKKMETLKEESLHFIQGRGNIIETTKGTIGIGGTRGYLCPNDSAFKESTDRSIYERELLRTEMALKDIAQSDIRILLLHYPPFNDTNESSGFTELLEYYQVNHCIFGHLHDITSFNRIPTLVGATKIHLVSADAAKFQLQQII